MPVNITYAELKETKGQPLPAASNETLLQLRDEMCSQSESRDFKLQNYQRFLRRVLSPDSPVRCLLMVHGTGTGKTCTAIQIAEEYIIRPEFQDKRVMVCAQPAVQDNFRTQIFDMTRVSFDSNGTLLSKQCTGRRYLDMLQRIQSEPLKWTDKASREKITTIAKRIIDEFYEFQSYTSFAFELNRQKEKGGQTHVEAWIHKTFDNRLLIVDEAHYLRETSDFVTTKLFGMAIEEIIKTANNVTLILLTATPMFDSFDEIIYYFNLFLWNDRKQDPKKTLQPSKIFTLDGKFLEGMETVFRGLCQEYVSFIKGDNPLSFPFRLPPPAELVAPSAKYDLTNKLIPSKSRRNILTLTQSIVQGVQLKAVQKLTVGGGNIPTDTICSLPEGLRVRTAFTSENGEFSYVKGVPKFLAPSQIAEYSSKFALIMNILKDSRGLIFVYSNSVEYGARMFAMCLEEHGYISALGNQLLKSSDEIPRGSMGKYILLTSEISETDRRKALDRVKRNDNVNGNDIKIIIASPTVSEGVDLRFVRQIHILEPWWNMSRIEQVVGRGIRTCSHQFLPFEEQNCTVYLHVCKLPNSEQELVDEHIYRTFVEQKSKNISAIKHVIMESAMDCPLQQDINSLPEDWKNLQIIQKRSQDEKEVEFKLSDLTSPMENMGDLTCKVTESVEVPDHERPLSAYIDVRDELLDKFVKLFLLKPVWTKKDLLDSPQLQAYDQKVIVYTLQNAIETGFVLKDRNGRVGFLESKGNMYAFTTGKFSSLQDRYIEEDRGTPIKLTQYAVEEKKQAVSVESKRNLFAWPGDARTRFSEEVLDWYIVDHILTEKERIEHMLTLDWTSPPIYAKPLVADGLHILGSKKIYTLDNELITPIGEQADTYTKWVTERMNLFLATRNKFFATMTNGSIVFNLDEKSEETLKRAERSKTIRGRACTSYSERFLGTFAQWLGAIFPKNIGTNTDRCQYLALLIRDAIIKKKEGIIWWTPEEFSIFLEPENSKELRTKLKV